MVLRLSAWCSRWLLTLGSVILLLGLAQGTAPAGAQAASQSASHTTVLQRPLSVPQGSGPPTILIHGVADAPDHLLGGCDGSTTWQRTEQFLASHGFTYVFSLGFMKGTDGTGEKSCGDNLYPWELSHQNCTSYYSSGDNGTWNEDDRHVACELAWYIWDNFTLADIPVNIVAHSLGGVFIKYALYKSGTKHDSHFPPYLYVHQVVTISSPLNGAQYGAEVACQGCTQVWELEQALPGGIWPDLTDPAAQGTQGAGGTNWTTLGQANALLNCDITGDSPFQGLSYGLKIDYSNPVWQSDPHLPGADACQFPAGVGQWYYGHGTYLLDDTSTAFNVPVEYCAGCAAGTDPNKQGTFSHSLEEVYLGLIGRCNTLSTITTCDGTDPGATGCNSTKSLLAGDPSYLKVYWTTHCTTNWASVSAPSGYLVTVTIARSPTKSWSNLSGKYVYCAPSRTTCPIGTWATFGPNTTAWYTDMLYSPSDAFAVKITTSTGATYTSIWH